MIPFALAEPTALDDAVTLPDPDDAAVRRPTAGGVPDVVELAARRRKAGAREASTKLATENLPGRERR